MPSGLVYNLDLLLRVSQIIHPSGPIPVSRSTWWQWVAEGKAPQPIRLGSRVTAWRAADIAQFLRQLETDGRN